MAELKDFGVVKSWYEAYKQVNEAKDEEKKKEDEKKPAVEVLPKEDEKDDNEEQEQKEPEKKDDSSDLKAENEKLKAEIEKLKLDISKKDAETNVEPNPETGEVPLRVGIAQAILDKKKKAEKKEVKEYIQANGTRRRVKEGDKRRKENKDKTELEEKLKPSDGPGEYVKDFKKSDAPQFKGKSDKKIQKMAIAAYLDAKDKNEDLEEAKSLNDLKKMLDSTTLLTPKEKKDIQSLEKKMGAKAYTKVLTKMFSEETEQLEEANAVEYARKLASYAVKRGGIDKKDFMKIADRMSNAKNDNDMKKIGDMIDGMDTEPRDLVQGSIALLMGPKTYLKMFGDRLTSRDMNQYKKMTPRDMKEETLDEGEAYDNDRFLVRGNTAKVDNKNTKDTKDHVYAPNAKTAIAMKKKGVKQFLDTLKMRKQFPTYKEEIELDEVNADAVGTITSKQMNALKKSYNSLPDRIDPEKAMALAKMLDRFGEGE